MPLSNRRVALSLSMFALAVSTAFAQVTYEEEAGALRDGTRYMMRVPSNWNGTLLRDLDYVTNADDPRYLGMLARGYAVSGTARHTRRWAGYYDPAREIAHLNTVHDLFIDRFREPDRVIQHGCSGGGHVTLAVAEDFSDRVDGAIAWAAHTPVWLMNSWLDGWFVMKALLAPELAIVDLPSDGSLRPRHAPLVFAWRQVVDEAQKTPEGRARLALAVAVGQWPDWIVPVAPAPDRDDPADLQLSMYRSIHRLTDDVGGISRYMLERAAGIRPTQLSWNTGVDYAASFANGNAKQLAAVRALYAEAGLDLDADLDKVDAFPRIEADEEALAFWSKPGRTVDADPKIPLLRVHDVGDDMVPLALVQGYGELVRENGKAELYRTAFTRAPTHCGFTLAENAAALETMTRRLDSGRWDDTGADAMNERARSIDESSPSRFIPVDGYEVTEYNRVWLPKQ